MGLLIFLMSIVIYAIISRTVNLTVLYYYHPEILKKMQSKDDLSTSEKLKLSDCVFPFLGDVYFLLAILYGIFIWPPLSLAPFLVEQINSYKQNRASRREYLNSLAKMGLTPKEIPAFVHSNKDLREYVEIIRDGSKNL